MKKNDDNDHEEEEEEEKEMLDLLNYMPPTANQLASSTYNEKAPEIE